jgi:cytochrome d ubiquinol oxidase subunit II
METLWFCFVAFLLAGYVILDGFDIGAGVISLIGAKDSRERHQVLQSIGPYWHANEVWLLAGGGVLYLAFPKLYASAFSGFYLPLMIVLWLLILRGIALKFHDHIDSPIWQPMWDRIFALSSLLLAVFYGAALGNVVRGVPLKEDGYFFLPLFTHWGVVGDVGILDWYTVLSGVVALSALTMHGALWVAMKTTGDLETRTARIAFVAGLATAALTGVLTLATFQIQPVVLDSFAARPWGWVLPIGAVAALAMMFGHLRAGRRVAAFVSSGFFLLAMMGSAAFSLFPFVLPSNVDPERGLTVWNTAAPGYGLRVAVLWFIPGMGLACAYAYYLYRRFAGKIDDGEIATYGA